jgi:HK97 family phage prohead protease
MAKMKKKEFSNGSLCNLHLRAAGEGEEESRVIEGTAIVFGKRSINLMPGHPTREMYEVIEPSAVTEELLNRSDIVLTYEHNQEAVLGAWVNGKGTLNLKRTDAGLDMSCALGQSTTAIDALDRVKRGDVRSMSFGMWVDFCTEGNVTYEKLEERSADGKEIWIRHINHIDGLFDVTICHRPAYPDTEVEVRSANDCIEEIVKKELDKKQEEEFEQEQMELRHQLFMMQQFNY